MADHLSSITSAQRVDMIQRGLNPINPAHVQKYLSGDKRGSVNENIERVKAIMGDKLNSSLGHAKESDREPTPGQEYNPNNFNSTPIQDDVQSIKQSMREEMNTYANKPMENISDLMSFDMPQQRPAPQQQNKEKINEAVATGKNLAVNYFNSFIQSLQQPSTQANLKVYKALKALLEQENALKSNAVLPHFQKSVTEVTSQMYKRITKQLNG